MSEVSFGTILGGFGAGLVSGPTLCEWAEEIERLGFDVLWFRDHVLWHSPVLDPFTALGALAARTTRVRLGTGVLLLPLRNPTLVAKAIASLDFFSSGRAILGIGIGGEFRQEYDACGVPVRERGRRANEAIEAIKALWTSSSATFKGRFYQFEGVVMEPRPRQQPYPPIWVGGRSDAALARAGKLGDGWYAYFVTPERFRASLDKALEYWHKRDTSTTTFASGLVLYFCIAPSYEVARREAAHYLATEYQQSFESLVDRYCALGSVSECIATIERYVDAGVRHVSLIPIGPPAKFMEQLQQLSAELFPRFRTQEVENRE
jgi:probable F420-dependent oxidoreductase